MKNFTQEQIEYVKIHWKGIRNKKIIQDLKITPSELEDILIILNFKKPEKFERICPSCSLPLKYKNSKDCYKSEKEGKICRNCMYKARGEKYSGKGNPFYGKTHSEEIKKKISEENKGKRLSPGTEFKKGNINKNHVTFKESLSRKYGEGSDLYKEKYQRYKDKVSFNTKGDKNPMYGKPSPIGSGNGWSGWYKGWYFRSINELSYMVNVIERFGISWVSGESKKFKIEYTDQKGITRNYFTDFILNGKYAIECKPKKLWDSNDVTLKKEAAMNYFSEIGIKYKIVECRRLEIEEIRKLRTEGNLKFLERYEIKYKKLYNN